MPAASEPFAVILGLSPTGLYAVRELGRAGIPIAGVAEGVQCGARSKFLTIHPVISADESDGSIVERLVSLARLRQAKGVLIPASDRFIELVVSHRDRLSECYEFQASYSPQAYQSIVDKARLLDLCRAHDLDYPMYYECDRNRLGTLDDDLQFPIIVKPALIHRVKAFMAGRKVLIARTRSEFTDIRAGLPDADTTWLVQEIVPGPESNITLYCAYFDRLGQPHHAFTARKLRQYVPGFGSASLVLSADLEETRELSEFILQKVGFQGIVGTEFKRDPRDGKLKMIEINPRPTLWFGVSYAAGKRISLAAFRDLTNQPMPPDQKQQDGVLWRYFWKDLYSSSFYKWKRGSFVLPAPEIGEVLSAKVTMKMGPVFDWSDMAPVYGELSNYARKLITRLSGPVKG